MKDSRLDIRRKNFSSNSSFNLDSLSLIGERESSRLILRSNKLNNLFNNRRKISTDTQPPNEQISEEITNLFYKTMNPLEKSEMILTLLNSNDYSYINYCIYMLNDLSKQDIDDCDYLRQIFSWKLINKLFSFLNLSLYEELKIEVKNSYLLKSRVMYILLNLAFYDIITLSNLNDFHINSFKEILENETDMDIIHSVFQFFSNCYNQDKKILSPTDKIIFNLSLNFLINYHQNNEVNLEKYENILHTCTLIIADYYKLIDQPNQDENSKSFDLTITDENTKSFDQTVTDENTKSIDQTIPDENNKSIDQTITDRNSKYKNQHIIDEITNIQSFNFLTLYLFVEQERKNILIGLYYIIEKCDNIDIVDSIDQTFVNFLFTMHFDKNYLSLHFYIIGIIINLCALDTIKIVKKLIELGLIKFLKKLFKSNESNDLKNALFILNNVVNNSIEEAIAVFEAGILQKVVSYSISEANNKLRKECINILSIACKYRDKTLLSGLVDMGILTAFTHVMKHSNFYEENECVLLSIMCIFDPEARDNEKNINSKKNIDLFTNLNGLIYLEKYLYNKNSISQIAEYLMNRYFDINQYQCDEESSVNYNEFN
jgi:hypothetical protein